MSPNQIVCLYLIVIMERDRKYGDRGLFNADRFQVVLKLHMSKRALVVMLADASKLLECVFVLITNCDKGASSCCEF